MLISRNRVLSTTTSGARHPTTDRCSRCSAEEKSNFRKHLVEDAERLVQIRFSVREAQESGLVRTRREIDPFLQAAPEELFEEFEILLYDVIDVYDLAVGEETGRLGETLSLPGLRALSHRQRRV